MTAFSAAILVTRHAKLLLSPHLFTLLMLSRLTCQSIYFQLSELNVNLLLYLGLIDVLSAKKHAENFACVLIGPKLICDAWILFGKASVISEFREPAWDVICFLKCTWPVQTSRFPPMIFNIASQRFLSNRKHDDTVKGFTIALTRDECHTHLSCRWPADLCCCLF